MTELVLDPRAPAPATGDEERYAHIGYAECDLASGTQLGPDPDVALCGYRFPSGAELHDDHAGDKPLCPACVEIDRLEHAVYPDRFWSAA